jgi:hypothetical protein
MRSKFFIILTLLSCLCLQSHAQDGKAVDSLKAAQINREAADPNFIHAYLMQITPGKACYSVYGHTAMRLVCPSKNLDICVTFEMDMETTHYADLFRRKAKAGYLNVPTDRFLSQYKSEGRGITAFELNLNAKQKQDLWRFVDEENSKGPVWTFDFTEVNCTSMAFYAINKVIEPSQLKFKKMPPIVYGELSEWMDYVSRKSPWVRLIVHGGLWGVDEKQIKPENLLTPEMSVDVLPYVTFSDSTGRPIPLVKGKMLTILPTVYKDEPCWFTPTMAMLAVAVLIILTITLVIYKRQRKHNYFNH